MFLRFHSYPTGAQSSIDGSPSEAEESQEDLKSIYAAQLAICEIKDAGSKPPATCDHFLPDKNFELSRKLAQTSDENGSMASALRRKLGLCLQSLESRPQHWTSYSNNRQNAVVMCQAARIHLDKGISLQPANATTYELTIPDNLIKLHESMVDAASGANTALGRAVTAANEALIRQEEYSVQVKRLHQQVIRDLEASKADTQSYLGNMLRKVGSAIQSMTEQLSDKLKDIGSDASDVKEALRSSTSEAEKLKTTIGRVFQQAVEGSAELAATHAKHWEATSSSTVELRDSLQNLREQEVNSLLGAFGSIHNQLVSEAVPALILSAKASQQASNELVALMYSRQNEMDKRLVNLDKSFSGLESTAAALHAMQTADTEAQLRLHNQVQTDLQVAQILLAEITASAANLQASVYDTSSKVTNMVAFGGFSSVFLNWGWSLIMVLMLYQFHPRLGGYAAVLLGKASPPLVSERNC
ncbi:MAG: hypothetical protein L6R35_006471 [Caloplaca aegaea]|nr:MAG: hypothetical protein L6R35_006471 [Caloplaca aegaea]